jgi:isoamylase
MPSSYPLGDPTRLGARLHGAATNVAVYSTAGDYGGSVSFCVLDDDGTERRFPLSTTPAGIWHARIDGLSPGLRYGFRASGPTDPARRIYFNPATLLVDPYALALTGTGTPRGRYSVLVDTTFDWGNDHPSRTRLADSVIYETHVRGFTMTHPDVEPKLRGTYAGLASPVILDYLVGLGVTAVQLLPVHESLTEQRLLDRNLTNYWGYSTIGYFSPNSRYATGSRGQQVNEFKAMVKALHAAGLEVILDVVYNHTAEGPIDQPALAWRGLANDAYYRFDPNNPTRYADTTGTGNSLNAGRLQTLQTITDSLRYWVTEMHVDGFRFDLAGELLRQHDNPDRAAAFVDLLYQDPIINKVKIIAEPWDIGSYDLGYFAPGWSEWNDRCRNTIRSFWLTNTPIGELATRIAGSSDAFQGTHRGPDASINYVASHDGRTVNDLVTFAVKHNEANGDHNTDGPDETAVNYGSEGPSVDAAVEALRTRAIRNLLTTALVCQGVPMLLGGDERRRTQQGNNNAYCQDNPISWYDWTPTPAASAMTAFVTAAIALRRNHPALRRITFLTGAPGPTGHLDITWFGPDGQSPNWDNGAPFLGFVLAGDLTDRVDADGAALVDRDVAVLINNTSGDVTVTVPGRPDAPYTTLLTTATDTGSPPAAAPSGTVSVPAQAIVVATAARA